MRLAKQLFLSGTVLFTLIVMLISSVQIYISTDEIILPIVYILVFSMNFFLFTEFKREEMVHYKIISVFITYTYLYVILFLNPEALTIYYFTFVMQFIYMLTLEKKVFYTSLIISILYQASLMVYFLQLPGINGAVHSKESALDISLSFSVVALVAVFTFHKLNRFFMDKEHDKDSLTYKTTKLSNDLQNLYFSKERTSETVYQFHQFIYNLEKAKIFFEKLLKDIKTETDIRNKREEDIHATLASSLNTVTELREDLEQIQKLVVKFNYESESQSEFISDEIKLTEMILNYNDTNNEDLNHLMDSTSTVYALVELIRGISNQINLLSLNAAIEATKSGESGKRFSVIAKEIKNLQIEVLSILQNITTEISTIERSSLNIKEGNKNIEKRTDDILSNKHDAKKLSENINSFLKELIVEFEVDSQKLSSVNSDLNNGLKRIDDIIASTANVQDALDDSSIYFVQQKKITNEIKNVLDSLQSELAKTSNPVKKKKD